MKRLGQQLWQCLTTHLHLIFLSGCPPPLQILESVAKLREQGWEYALEASFIEVCHLGLVAGLSLCTSALKPILAGPLCSASQGFCIGCCHARQAFTQPRSILLCVVGVQ